MHQAEHGEQYQVGQSQVREQPSMGPMVIVQLFVYRGDLDF